MSDAATSVAFHRFLREQDEALKGIARATGGEYQLDDVRNEAWIKVVDLAARLDRVIDVGAPEDQKLILGHLYQELVRYRERHVRFAQRLDHPRGHDDGPLLRDALPDDRTPDPVAALMEEEAVALRTEQSSGLHLTLAGAWVQLMRSHRNRMEAVARFLRISRAHSYRCCAGAAMVSHHQRPLPLRLAADAPFAPRPWRRYRLYRAPEQLAFDFEYELPLR